MVNPLQSALTSALNGVRGATRDQATAAQAIERASLVSPDQAASTQSESMASPDVYAAVSQQLQARGKLVASLDVLKVADRMLQETVRTL